jgi:hypothetical protein
MMLFKKEKEVIELILNRILRITSVKRRSQPEK